MRDSFHSVSAGGLRQNLLPMRLWQLSKRWFWDPAAIDFGQDAHDWQQMSSEEQDLILRLTSLFQAGEEAVTLDLLPLIRLIGAEGRLEEEIYLTAFLFEEAKHVEFFARFLAAVGVQEDMHRYHSPAYRRIFYEALPAAMNRLAEDPSPAAQARAAVTYNIVVEGLLAETGYHGYLTVLRQQAVLPGLAAGIAKTKRDESRHLAWGVYHLARLIGADPSLFRTVEATAESLLEPAFGIINEIFDSYRQAPFGLTRGVFLEYAVQQYQKRMNVLERARGRTADEMAGLIAAELEVEP
jgi:ribonucleoside-diphosphate reductase beta chain